MTPIIDHLSCATMIDNNERRRMTMTKCIACDGVDQDHDPQCWFSVYLEDWGPKYLCLDPSCKKPTHSKSSLCDECLDRYFSRLRSRR